MREVKGMGAGRPLFYTSFTRVRRARHGCTPAFFSGAERVGTGAPRSPAPAQQCRPSRVDAGFRDLPVGVGRDRETRPSHPAEGLFSGPRGPSRPRGRGE